MTGCGWFWTSRAGLALALVAGAAAGAPAQAASAGASVVVVYNERVPESRNLARYYARKRDVPPDQVFGLDLPVEETLTRADYQAKLEEPLVQRLQEKGLLKFVVSTNADPFGPGSPCPTQFVEHSAIRYLVLCYGVPVRILPDPALSEPLATNLPPELRRDEAAVDSQLAALPFRPHRPLLTGPIPSPVYGATNRAVLGPAGGVLMVARLDGPSPSIAQGLVDKALAAETNGLWGRAYFDLRGITNGTYGLGEHWLRTAAEVSRRTGFETVVDEKEPTWPAWFPASQVAWYAGWYDATVSGPWAQPAAEFVPGSFAYHLHSFSGHILRTSQEHWVGPLLARGATATVGFTTEPFLQMTLDLGQFWSRFIPMGFTFGEAAYAALNAISWQATVVGDPLYCPFAQPNPGDTLGHHFRDLHARLEAQKSPLLAWSHLQVANLNLATGQPAADLVQYLEAQARDLPSSILFEKLGDLSSAQGRLPAAIEAYRQALARETTPLQRMRLMLALARLREVFTQEAEALALYQEFLQAYPDYGDRLTILQRMLPIARRLRRTNEVEGLNQEILKLTPPAAAPSR